MKKLYKISWAEPCIEKEEHEAIQKVMNSNWLTQGPITQKLEKKISQTIGSKHTIVMNNGTSSLICSLLSHGIGPNDEVIVPSFTFVATVNAILSVGAKPILIDCDPKTFNTDVNLVKRKITKKTKAIIPVDVSGMPVDIDSFRDLTQEKNIILIQDSAESLGAKYKQKKVGSFGHSTIFSFHMAKIVAGIEGGCIVTNDDEIAQRARLIRSHGDAHQYSHRIFGLNFRISDLHSAIIFEQLKKINKFLNHRNHIAKIYKSELSDFEFQEIPDFVSMHPYMLFPILTSKKHRNNLNNYLQKNGIETRICWLPVHKQPYHSTLFNIKLKNSEFVYSKILNLPMGNGLTENNCQIIINAIKKYKSDQI
ncbi:MAG: DegT/DnrJ/EryC1/StrS family aminotransferase [Nitrosarchaeum sp.]